MRQFDGELGSQTHELVLVDAPIGRGRGGGIERLGEPDDVDDVDVGDVVELACSGLAHSDDSQGHGVGSRPYTGAGDSQSGIQGGVRESGHAFDHHSQMSQWVGAGQIIGGDGQQTVPVSHPHGGGGRVDARPPLVALSVAEGGANRLAHNDIDRRLGGGIDGVRGIQSAQVLGVTDQEVPQRLRGPQDGQEPMPVLDPHPRRGVLLFGILVPVVDVQRREKSTQILAAGADGGRQARQ